MFEWWLFSRSRSIYIFKTSNIREFIASLKKKQTKIKENSIVLCIYFSSDVKQRQNFFYCCFCWLSRLAQLFLNVNFLCVLSGCFSVCKPAWDNRTMRADWDFVAVNGFPLCKKRWSLPLDAYTSGTVINLSEQNKSLVSVAVPGCWQLIFFFLIYTLNLFKEIRLMI